MKIFKVGELVDGVIRVIRRSKSLSSDFMAAMTDLDQVEFFDPTQAWSMEILTGKGTAASTLKLNLPIVIRLSDDLSKPLFLGKSGLVFFKGRFFMPEHPPKSLAETEEISLRVKKAVYDDEAELAALRASVANMEAALQFSKSGPQRERIPEDVKLVVWARDGGSCTRCGAKASLHFDHIIPVAKGGGNSAENIQILCQPCNLAKSDKIAT